MDDVFALDYLKSWVPTPILTDDERADINKRLMHVSIQRVRLNAAWDLRDLAERVIDGFGKFHNALGAR